MIEEEIKIENKNGLHARPANMLTVTTKKFKSQIFISKDGYEVNGKSILGVMTLAAEPGSVIKVRIEGEDEQEAMEAIKELIRNKFHEE
ncbi:phosphocarrier protein HPr [candidate division KSB1 bacterium 4484_188]|nr:MAG: phosphocarrier protein HPr [candidate division KSB1 bacterium 4484_188]HFE64377.1 HPr family phosphocarrier protein [Caldithrix sp.]